MFPYLQLTCIAGDQSPSKGLLKIGHLPGNPQENLHISLQRNDYALTR